MVRVCDFPRTVTTGWIRLGAGRPDDSINADEPCQPRGAGSTFGHVYPTSGSEPAELRAMGSSRHEKVVGHLPLEINEMVGRRQETAEIRRIMASHRLVTVTGPGGIGKTRTALHVARSARRTFADGAWFVELGSLRDPSLVGQVVLEALKVPDSSARDPVTVLIEYLRGRETLLVVDNCEHLVVGVARLVDAVLREVSGVHVLATSRQPLGVPGEATYRLATLPVPAEEFADVPLVSGFASIELFAARARAALGSFEVDASNIRDVVRLCTTLEALPLALELAASRLKVMTIDELLRRLDDRFTMLKGSSTVGAPRHQTLLAAVAWSHDLCTPAEKILWRRASVFPGGFDLNAAEEVCSGGDLPRDQVLDALLGLVDKSVVVNEQGDGRVRFRMLATIREFGSECLAEAGELESLRAAHCAWTSGMLADAAAEWFGPGQVEWTARLRLAQSDIRAALEFCATHSDYARVGQRMAGECWFHWIAGEYLSEGRLWLERLLAADTRPSVERALALRTAAGVSALQGDTGRADQAAVECEELASDLARPDLVAYGVHMRALSAFFASRAAEAEDLFLRARTLYADITVSEAWRLLLLVHYGAMHALQGDLPVAAGLFEETHSRSEEHGDQWARSYAVWGRGLVSFHAGELEEAETSLLRSIEMKRPFHDLLGLALALDALAWVLAAKGQALPAARLVGAASWLWSTFGTDLFGSEFFTAQRAQCEAAARQALGDPAYVEAVGQGASASLDDTLGELVDNEPAQPAPRRTKSLLTRREQEVAALVAEGLTNQEIADRLVISTRTAEAHVEHVLRKMDFRSRSQIATWYATRLTDLTVPPGGVVRGRAAHGSVEP